MILGTRQYQILMHLVTTGPRAAGEFDHLPVLRNTVYSILRALESKGHVTSSMSDPVHKRGGKARRIFKITDEGRRAIEAFDSELEASEAKVQ